MDAYLRPAARRGESLRPLRGPTTRWKPTIDITDGDITA
jgi:hypothetical protein